MISQYNIYLFICKVMLTRYKEKGIPVMLDIVALLLVSKSVCYYILLPL